MSMTGTDKSNQSFDPIPEGVHVAVCYGMVDLGTQKDEYQGKEIESSKILILWVIPEETYDTEDGLKPRMISKEFTNSLNSKSNLRKSLESWRGKAFTAEELEGFYYRKLLGVGCQLQIIHAISKTTGNPYHKISAIMGLPKGMQIEPPSELIFFDMDDENWQMQIAELPEWIAEKIRGSNEYVEWKTQTELPFTPYQDTEELPTPDDDDIPF